MRSQNLPIRNRLPKAQPLCLSSMAWGLAVAAVVFALWLIIPPSLPSVSPCQMQSSMQIVENSKLIYEQQEGTYATRGAKQEDPLKSAFQQYDQGRYGDFIAEVGPYVDTSNTSKIMKEVIMCLAVSHLMVGDAEGALPYLSHARGFRQPKFAKEANWYEALAYRQLGEKKRSDAFSNRSSQIMANTRLSPSNCWTVVDRNKKYYLSDYEPLTALLTLNSIIMNLPCLFIQDLF